MTDTELKEEGKKVFEKYWTLTKITLGQKIPEELKGFISTGFVAGYVEGWRGKEEYQNENK